MFTVLLVIHVFVTLALIGVVLIQRSEGGGLGIGGGQGMGSFMTGRGTANLLTRTTAILATVFLALSLVLALMTRNSTSGVSSIFNAPVPTAPVSTAPMPGAPVPSAPTPSAPVTAPTAPAPAAGPGSSSSSTPSSTTPAKPAQPSAPATP
jgi:preprotein translocase subunit SecG